MYKNNSNNYQFILTDRMADEQPNAKRRKTSDAIGLSSEEHIGEDLSKTNVDLPRLITEKLYLDQSSADIQFLFEELDDDGMMLSENVPAHKLILSTGSQVFHAMFYGAIPEGNEVKIIDVGATAFKEFLQFFYIDNNITLSIENIAEVMYLIRKYGIERCMKQCVEFLIENLEIEHACLGYQLAIKLELDDLRYFCERKISASAEIVMKSESFLNCEWMVFNEIMQLDSLVCAEPRVFDAAVAWAKKSCEKKGLPSFDMQNLRDQLNGSLRFIHFKRITIEDFVSRAVDYCGLFTLPELVDILQMIVFVEYESTIFRTNPFSDAIFSWHNNRVVECSIANKLTERAWTIPIPYNTFPFSTDKHFLLGKIRLSAACSNFCLQLVRDSTEIIFDSRDSNINNSLFKYWSQYFKFTKPILIKPKNIYTFNIMLENPYDIFTMKTMRQEKLTFNKIEIEFGAGVSGVETNPIVDTFYINRL